MRKYDFGFTQRPRLRLSRIEEILKETQIVDPIPSRQTLIRRLEDGTLSGYFDGYCWWVYEDAFKAWIRSMHPEEFNLIPQVTP